MKNNAPSIHDVAKQSCVSIATVSRVLNNGPVSAKTREKVERAIRATGYHPNLSAINLRTRNTRRIGFIIPDIANPAYSLTVSIAHEHLRRHDYQLILGNTYGSPEEEIEVLQMMCRERVSGLILNTFEGEDNEKAEDIFTSLIRQNVRLVFLGPRKTNLPIDNVCVNNRVAMEKAVNLLVQTGRKKIAFLSGQQAIHTSSQRRKGFTLALAKHQMPPGPIVCKGSYTLANGKVLAEQMLSREKVDAIICGNDLMAIGVLQAAEENGIRVPKDLAIIGFDNIELASLIRPRLTTIHQPFDQIVSKACSLILESSPPHTKSHEYLVEPEIIVREST